MATLASMDPVEKKLDMSLDAIAHERGYVYPHAAAMHVPPPFHPMPPPPMPYGYAPMPYPIGRTKNTRRADRLAQAGPYQAARAQRYVTMGGPMVGAPMMPDASASRRVYVGNLSWNVKWQDLKDHMRRAGTVEHATVLEYHGRSKGCGIVTYATEDEARAAIATLNDTELDGRKIFVREDREEPVVAGWPPKPPRGSRVYVGNLPWNVQWQDLKDFMKKAGNVVHADVLEEGNGRSKGCGLVEYSSPMEAQYAIAMLNDTELNGRKIFVREDREPEGGSISSIAKRGRPSAAARAAAVPVTDGTSLFVGNLPWDVTWQGLKDLFRTIGEVERAEIAQFPDGRSRGYGLIRYTNPAHARQAIEQLNGTEMNGRALEVRYDNKAQPAAPGAAAAAE